MYSTGGRSPSKHQLPTDWALEGPHPPARAAKLNEFHHSIGMIYHFPHVVGTADCILNKGTYLPVPILLGSDRRGRPRLQVPRSTAGWINTAACNIMIK